MTAAATGAFFLAVLFGFYVSAILPMLVVVALAWRWAAEIGSKADLGLLDIGRGQRAFAHHESPDPPGWWGSIITLMANATFFMSLLFGFAFLATVAPGWPPSVLFQPSLIAGAGVVFGVFIALIAEAIAFRRTAREALSVACEAQTRDLRSWQK